MLITNQQGGQSEQKMMSRIGGTNGIEGQGMGCIMPVWEAGREYPSPPSPLGFFWSPTYTEYGASGCGF